MQRREDWLKRPLRRLAALLTAILLYSIPCVAILITIWRYVTGDPGTNAYAVPMALLATVTVVVIITHVYETVFLLRDWESDRLRSALNDQARLRAELEALGREVAPHFLFNNLHALSHLIEGKGTTASAFIQALSATYRYVLDARGRTLVPLAEELEALGHVETLAAIRFSGGAQLKVDVDPDAAERLLLPPVTLSELFHNALKHNAADPASPLTVGVRLEDQTLIFENVCRACDERGPSTGVGLDNLRRRFELATGRSVTWGKVSDRFVVTLPLVASPALPTSSASPFRPSPDSSS
jgi:LytS/YehU family sensor histidine kinase